MCFHCFNRNAKVIGNLLIETAVDDALEHLLFARSELFNQSAVGCECLTAGKELLGGTHGTIDQLLQLRLLEGLLNEVHGTFLKGLNSLRNIAVTSDKDEGGVNAAAHQMILHICTRHAGHAQVAQNNRRYRLVELRDEGFTAFIILNAVVGRFKQPLDRFAHIGVIVDHVYQTVLIV